MATCKDCLYFNRCVVLGVELDIKHNKEADKNCRHFKNKADFVEVKHGKWKPIVKQYNYLEPPYCDTCKCSVCNYVIDVSETFYGHCPNCGAKMDGKNDNDLEGENR